MRRLVVVLLCVVCMATVAHAQPRTAQQVVLVGWDGVNRSDVIQMMEEGRLPNLAALGLRGSMVNIDVLRYSYTKPGWAQILTGYNPEITGVWSNQVWQPAPVGSTIFEVTKGYFGPQFATGAIIGKSQHVHESLANAVTAMDDYQWGLMFADIVEPEAEDFLRLHRRDPFFLFVHFGDPDYYGHVIGGDSPEYFESIEACDYWLGRMVRLLSPRTLVYVTTDHGFPSQSWGTETSAWTHFDHPYIWLVTNDKHVIRRGDRVDIAPTIYWRFGIPDSFFDPPLSGHALQLPYNPPKWGD